MLIKKSPGDNLTVASRHPWRMRATIHGNGMGGDADKMSMGPMPAAILIGLIVALIALSYDNTP